MVCGSEKWTNSLTTVVNGYERGRKPHFRTKKKKQNVEAANVFGTWIIKLECTGYTVEKVPLYGEQRKSLFNLDYEARVILGQLSTVQAKMSL